MPPALKPKKKSIGILQVMIMWTVGFPLVWFAYPTLLVIGIGMIPTFVSWLVEDNPGKPRTFSIGGFNICGTLPYVIELWQGHQTLSFAIHMFLDANTWLTMYGTASVGYFIYWAVPRVIIATLRVTARQRIKRLKKIQEAMLAEWGDEIRPEKRKQLQSQRMENLENPKKRTETPEEDENLLGEAGNETNQPPFKE